MNPAQERAHAEASSGLSVSVVVNNYNYAHYLPQALDSVLAQLAPQDELIVVDDGSGDGSAEILASYAAQQHVRVIRQANRGQLSAVLEGLSVAHGDLCALLDSDDYFLPGYLARLRRHAEQNPEADFFFCAASPGGEAEEAVRETKAMLARIEVPPGLTGSSRWSTWAGGEFLGSPTSGLALRRALRDTLLEHRERLSDRVVIPRWAVRFFAISTTSHAYYRASVLIARCAKALLRHAGLLLSDSRCQCLCLPERRCSQVSAGCPHTPVPENVPGGDACRVAPAGRGRAQRSGRAKQAAVRQAETSPGGELCPGLVAL